MCIYPNPLFIAVPPVATNRTICEISYSYIDVILVIHIKHPEPENNRVRLHPENSSMEDIYVDNCIIQGGRSKF